MPELIDRILALSDRDRLLVLIGFADNLALQISHSRLTSPQRREEFLARLRHTAELALVELEKCPS